MCGRFTLAPRPGELAEVFGVEEPAGLKARYNIAPSQAVAAVRHEKGKPRLVPLHWGLVPGWSKDPGISRSMINARSETVADKPSFKAAFKRRRCLIPATGFYEWDRKGKGKTPHLFRTRDGKPFGLAAVWEEWEGPDGYLQSFAIITTKANRTVGKVHDRMPVIISRDNHSLWLAADARAEYLKKLMHPFDDARMEAWQVSDKVNNPENDSPDLVRPFGQQSLL